MKKDVEFEYTMFRVNYVNFNHNDGDYIICRDMGEVCKILYEVDNILDSEPDDDELAYSVTISPLAMTISQYETYLNTQPDNN